MGAGDSKSGAPSPAPRAPAVLSPGAVAGGTLVLTAAVALTAGLLAERSLAAQAVQTVMAEWGASRLGVVWSADEAALGAAVAARAARGAGLGLAAAGIVVVFARLTHGLASVSPLASLMGLALALVDAVLAAVRDELLLHGTTLRLARRLPAVAQVVACGLASAAWSFGTDEGAALAPHVVAEGLVGVFFGAMWVEDRGAWAPCAAHAAWLMGTRGALIARGVGGAWGGAGGVIDGWSGAAALAAVALVSAVWARRGAAVVETSARARLPG